MPNTTQDWENRRGQDQGTEQTEQEGVAADPSDQSEPSNQPARAPASAPASASVPWRVKLYQLDKDGGWQDQGTGDAQCAKEGGTVTIIVTYVPDDADKDEDKDKDKDMGGEGQDGQEQGQGELLRVPIRVDENYERQQDSIIMWREPSMERDCALSFQEVSNCEALWLTILRVQDTHSRSASGLLGYVRGLDSEGGDANQQRLDVGAQLGYSHGSGGSQNIHMHLHDSTYTSLPQPSVESLLHVKSVLCSTSPGQRRELAELLLADDGAYVLQLLDPELLESAKKGGEPGNDNSALLADIARSVALLGNEAVLDLLLGDGTFLQFATVMECDSSLPAGSMSFRKFLQSNAASMQSIPGVEISDAAQLALVTRLFRIRFLRDSLVRPGLEETGAALIEHQLGAATNDICGLVFGDAELLTRVFLAINPVMDIKESPARPIDTTTSAAAGDGGKIQSSSSSSSSNSNSSTKREGSGSQGGNDDAYSISTDASESDSWRQEIETIATTASTTSTGSKDGKSSVGGDGDSSNSNTGESGKGRGKGNSSKRHRRQRSATTDTSQRQSQALRFLRELFGLSRMLSFERRTELYDQFSARDMGTAFLDLCLSVLLQPEETSGESREDAAEMLCCYSVVCPDRVRQYVLLGATPSNPPIIASGRSQSQVSTAVEAPQSAPQSSSKPTVETLSTVENAKDKDNGNRSNISQTTEVTAAPAVIIKCGGLALGGSSVGGKRALNHLSVWVSGQSAQIQSQNELCLLWVIMRRIVLDSNVADIDMLGDTLRMLLNPDRFQRQEKDKFLNSLYDHYIQWLLVPLTKSTSALTAAIATSSSKNNAISGDRERDRDTAGVGVGVGVDGTPSGSCSLGAERNGIGTAEPVQVSTPTTFGVTGNVITGAGADAGNSSSIAPAKSRPALLATYRVLLDTLCVCVSGHSYRMKYYMLRNNTIVNVLELLNTPYRCLQLAAVRFVRTIVATQDEFYYRHIVKTGTLKPLMCTLRDTPNKDCLLTSTILELVDLIRREGLGLLGDYIINECSDCFSHRLHSSAFEDLCISINERKAAAASQGSTAGSTNSRGGSGSISQPDNAADQRWLAAQADDDAYSTEAMDEDQDQHSQEGVGIDTCDSVGICDKDPTAGSSSCSVATPAPTPRRLAFLALAYGTSDPSGLPVGGGSLGPLDIDIDHDVADTGTLSPRSAGTASPGTPGSAGSESSLCSLSPPTSPPRSVSGKRKASGSSSDGSGGDGGGNSPIRRMATSSIDLSSLSYSHSGSSTDTGPTTNTGDIGSADVDIPLPPIRAKTGHGSLGGEWDGGNEFVLRARKRLSAPGAGAKAAEAKSGSGIDEVKVGDTSVPDDGNSPAPVGSTAPATAPATAGGEKSHVQSNSGSGVKMVMSKKRPRLQ